MSAPLSLAIEVTLLHRCTHQERQDRWAVLRRSRSAAFLAALESRLPRDMHDDGTISPSVGLELRAASMRWEPGASVEDLSWLAQRALVAAYGCRTVGQAAAKLARESLITGREVFASAWSLADDATSDRDTAARITGRG